MAVVKRKASTIDGLDRREALVGRPRFTGWRLVIP
jgi:hypothetical protein